MTAVCGHGGDRESALKLHRAGIPLFALIGTPEEAADVVLRGAIGGRSSPDPKIRAGATVDSPGFDGRNDGDRAARRRLLYEQSLTLTGKLQEVVLEFDSLFEGFAEYSVSLAGILGERLDDTMPVALGSICATKYMCST